MTRCLRTLFTTFYSLSALGLELESASEIVVGIREKRTTTNEPQKRTLETRIRGAVECTTRSSVIYCARFEQTTMLGNRSSRIEFCPRVLSLSLGMSSTKLQETSLTAIAGIGRRRRSPLSRVCRRSG